MKRLSLSCLLLALSVGACDDGQTDDLQTDEFRWGSSVDDLEVVAAFNAAAGETPESVAVDLEGNLIVPMALTGEIRKIAPNGQQSTLAWIPLGQCAPNPFPPILGAVAVDVFSNVYVGAAACDPANRGVWRISPEGNATLVASLPQTALPNGIAVRAARVYVADTGSTIIWRAPTFGDGSPAEVWTDEPLLADPNPFDPVPGANGLQFYGGSVFVANAGAATIVQIPFTLGGPLGGDLEAGDGIVKYGPPGSGAVHVTDASFPGCDDFAFDLGGRLYCTTDPFQTVLRISTKGKVEVLWTAEDGLDGPTAATFGRDGDRTTLYVSNAAFPFFPSTGNGPSILKADVGALGYPLR